MGQSHRRSLFIALALGLIAAATAVETRAQGFSWPENPENIKVLGDSVKGADLGEFMRGFAFALDVRCSHCHMGEGNDLTQYDFPADDKETKRIARVMIQMVQEINASHLAPVDTLREEPETRVAVTCMTCHRGQRKPQMIEDVLTEQIEAEGVEAAEATYKELREEHYGGFTYDFSPGPLSSLAERLAAEGKVDEAVAMLELEIEYNPESYSSYFTLARIQARAERTEDAIVNLEKAIEYAPDRFKGFLRGELERLRGQ